MAVVVEEVAVEEDEVDLEAEVAVEEVTIVLIEDMPIT